jgi:hypothetical protein
MQFLRCLILLCVFPVAVALAQHQRQTDVESHGFLGHVKSVSAHVEMSGTEWSQPEGPGLLDSGGFTVREYDADGNWTRLGEILPDGRFFGETMECIRNANGQVVERIDRDFATGKTNYHDWLGPYGVTEGISYIEGKVSNRGIFTYDRLGYLANRLTLDAAGNRVGELMMRYADDGAMLEQSSWGSEGQLSWRESYDAAANLDRFEIFDTKGLTQLKFFPPGTKVNQAEPFDPTGLAQLTYALPHGESDFLWAASDRSGDKILVIRKDKRDVDRYRCHRDGTCEVAHIHFEYADATNHDPVSAEWKDSDGKLLYAAYYKYTFDGQKNWISRTIWVRSPSLSTRTLYENDSRSITYWEK